MPNQILLFIIIFIKIYNDIISQYYSHKSTPINAFFIEPPFPAE